MSKIKFAALGVAALGVAALPVAASYAADDITAKTNEVEYGITIDDSITLANAGAASIVKTAGMSALVDDSTTALTVTTNHSSGFNLTVIDTDATTALTNATNDTIAYNSDSAVAAGTAGWQLLNGFDSDAIIALPADGGTAAVLKTQNGPTTTDGVSGAITFKAATANNTAAGTYTDSVIYTAAVK